MVTHMNNRIVVLEFDAALDTIKDGKSLRYNLSAVLQVGNNLLVASDETTFVERLTTTDDGFTFRHNKRFLLSKFFHLPQGDGKEIDIEGLAHSDNHLWVIGSHSLSRSKPKLESSDIAQDLKRLARIDNDANRYLLARIPALEREGVFELFESCPNPSNPSDTLT